MTVTSICKHPCGGKPETTFIVNHFKKLFVEQVKFSEFGFQPKVV